MCWGLGAGAQLVPHVEQGRAAFAQPHVVHETTLSLDDRSARHVSREVGAAENALFVTELC